jgi:malonyl-CoA/methylmalonyl-CoA synthetase
VSDNLYDLIEARIGNTTGVLIETSDGRALDGRDLLERSGQFANVLAVAGVMSGDRVAAQVDKSAEALILFLACLRIGAIFLPLNPAYTLAELEYFIADSEPRLCVCRPQSLPEVQALADRFKVDRLHSLGTNNDGSLAVAAAQANAEFSSVARTKDDVAAILYTSGTTGRSKGAMITHGNLRANAEVLADCWRFTDTDTLIHALPIFHTHGLFVAANVALLSGAKMLLLPRFDVDAVMAALPRATVMMGVPTYYMRLLKAPNFDARLVKGMRLFISGSAPLLAETHREWEARTGHAIVERYGLTETNINASTPYDGPRTPGTVGLPLPGVALRIVDSESGSPLPVEQIGMIEVKGPNVFKGYWRMPDQTAAVLRKDGFFVTGDLGKIDASDYVHIVGRKKDLIISGGLNIYPKEVENEIDSLQGVVESAVIGVPHPDFGEAVTAVVVAEETTGLDEGAILARLESRLAKFKLPKRIFFVASLPRNAMGKVQKNLLREEHKAAFAPP